jgi:multiple sugar transport system permease protein
MAITDDRLKGKPLESSLEAVDSGLANDCLTHRAIADTRQRARSGIRPAQVAVYAVLLVGLSVTLLPFIWMVLSSFKTGTEMIRVPPTFFPEKPVLDNYRTIFTDKSLPLGRFYFNSAFVAVFNLCTTLFMSSLLGYVFAKYQFRGKRLLFGYFLLTMMIPSQVTMIPSYLILVRLHLVNTLWGLVVPAFLDAFGIFMMRQFIETLPNELIDAARIDGASEWQIYLRVVLPQLGAPLATLGTLTFMANWNAYLWPLVVITDINRRTLPIILVWYRGMHLARPQMVLTATILVILPILLVYMFFQRWIVRGIATTGFK